jgi:glycosyltransferase involved in cell wall biosynthesis
MVVARRIDDGPISRLTDSLTGPPPFEPYVDGDVQVVPLAIAGIRRAALASHLTYIVPGLRRYAWGRARIPTARLYARIVAPLIARHARGATVIHAWGADLLGVATIRAARLCRAASVVTAFAHEGQYGTGPVDRLVYRTADRLVALLQTDANLYRRLGAPPGRVVVCGVASHGIRNGHDDAIRTQYAIDGPLVLFLGDRRPYKGHDLLLRAAAEVPEATFAFVGPGPALEQAEGRVLDVGAVDAEERNAWLGAADLLCLPSSGEILPSSILEGWSVGTPVLTSDIPALQELVESTGGGFTVPREPSLIARRLRELLAEPDHLRAAGAAGSAAWRKRYTPEAVAVRHAAMYEELTSQRGAT